MTEYFRESLVIELFWKDKIDYRIDEKINNKHFKKLGFLKIFKKYVSKRIRKLISR